MTNETISANARNRDRSSRTAQHHRKESSMTNETIIANARKSFPNAADDTEALCLMLRYLDGVRAERISAMNLNAQQAVMLVRAYGENDRLRNFSEGAA